MQLIELTAKNAWKNTSVQKNSARKREKYDPKSFAASEPKIEYLSKVLSIILKSVNLYRNGQELNVTSFKLKSNEDWISQGSVSSEELFQFLSHTCKVRCEFCYLRGSPDDAVTQFSHLTEDESRKELEYRLKLSRNGLKLFTPTFHTEEVIGHPLFLEYARRIREHSNELFVVSTTGYTLTDDFIISLKELGPVEIRISLNSISKESRIRSMRDRSDVVRKALSILKRENIRYTVSLVAWPAVGLKEIERTIRFASKFAPHAIYVILPGYTKYYSQKKLFDLQETWKEISVRAIALRNLVRAPLIIHPRLFETNILGDKPNTGKVIGITEGSPAYYSGLQVNDVITKVESRNIHSLRELDTILKVRHQARYENTNLTVLRGGRELEVNVSINLSYRKGYHSQPPFNDLLGIHVISQGLALSDIVKISDAANRHQANVVAINTSVIVLPSLIDALQKWASVFDGLDIELIPFVANNEYYGGNICISELNTVSDLELGIDSLLNRGLKPDLILIPSPPFNPSGWMRDIRGIPFTRLKYKYNFVIEPLIVDAFE